MMKPRLSNNPRVNLHLNTSIILLICLVVPSAVISAASTTTTTTTTTTSTSGSNQDQAPASESIENNNKTSITSENATSAQQQVVNNELPAATTRHLKFENQALSHNHHHNHLALMRLGSQSIELNEAQKQPPSSSPSRVAEARVDLPPPPPPSQANHGHGQAPNGLANHKDHYPIEPYPSASYTNLVQHSPTSGPTSATSAGPNSDTNAANHQLIASSIDALLNREHHHDIVGGSLLGGEVENYFTNHIKNLDDNYVASSTNQQQIYNHNYNQANKPSQSLNNNNKPPSSSSSSSTSTLNAGLIQNLTASLFPVKQLTNSTLLSLSELLNKTRHQQQHQQQSPGNQHNQSTPTQPFISNAYRPPSSLLLSSGLVSGQQQFGDSPASRNTNQLGFQQQQQQLQLQPGLGPTSALLNALFDDSQSNSNNLFDYITRNPNNQFGFREPSSKARFQSNHGQYPQKTGHPSAYTRTPSNIYNTYLPLKDGSQASAASLYDSYVDQSGYKYPLSVNSINELSVTRQRDNNNFKQFNGQQQQQQHSYQFLQNTNNGQHLDKIVYHSTPFRPSIVSPPSSSSANFMGSNNNNNNTSTSWTKLGESKAPQHASLPESPTSDSTGQTPDNVGQRMVNASRYPTTSSTQLNPFRQQQQQQQQQQQMPPGTRLSANTDHHHHSGLNFEHQSLNNTSEMATINQLSEILLLSRNNSTLGGPTMSATRQQTVGYQPTTTTSTNSMVSGVQQQQQQPVSGLTSGPQMLFDIYEREIDNQIRDALYVDHYNHFNQQPATQTSPIQSLQLAQQATAASSSPQTMWPFATDDSIDPSINQQLAAVSPASPTSTWTTRPLPSMVGGQSPGTNHQPRPAASLLQQSIVPASGSGQFGTTYVNHNHLTPSSSSISDPLVAALQELPTFSASDLQPMIPAGPAYSLVSSGAQNVESSTDNSLAALASQLLPVNAQYSDLVSFLNDNDQSFGLNTNHAGKQSSNHQHNQHSSNNNNHGNGNSGLPSILLKLNSGQISSILTSPLAHLYANLPRYRYNKSKQPQQQQYQNNQQQTPSSSAPVGSILAPNSIISKQFWSALSNGGQNTQLDTNKPEPQLATMQSNFNKQQAAAMAAATAAANWIAATGQSLTPLQVALIQAQAATSAYLGATNPSQSEQTNPATNFATESNSQQQNLSLGSLVGGLAGGGISPLIWRSVLSPMHWARKQTSASQQTNQNGSLQASDSIPNAQQTSKPLAFPFVNSLWASSGGSFGPFSSFGSSSNQQTTASIPKSTSSSKSPKLKIKILKIPVAFYDSSPSATNEVNHLDGHHLMPAHLQPSPTASLLANMPCAYHNHYPLTNPSMESNIPFPLSESQLFTQTNQLLGSRGLISQFNKPTASPKLVPDSTTNSTPAQPSTQASSSSSSLSSSSSSTKKSEHDRSFQMQYFTDINQPNDLQVSPSTTVTTTSSQERPTKLL